MTTAIFDHRHLRPPPSSTTAIFDHRHVAAPAVPPKQVTIADAMPARRAVDPAQTRAAVLAVEPWLRDETCPPPSRAELAAAVRLTARTLAALAPGAAVEVRIPPFVAVQCLPGPPHRRGTPPNVVETDPRTWLLLATGLASVSASATAGRLRLSGARASDVVEWLPLVPL